MTLEGFLLNVPFALLAIIAFNEMASCPSSFDKPYIADVSISKLEI